MGGGGGGYLIRKKYSGFSKAGQLYQVTVSFSLLNQKGVLIATVLVIVLAAKYDSAF